MLLKKSLLLMIDTETTGIPSRHGAGVRPVQIGALAMDRKTGEEVSSFKLPLCPDVWVEGYEGAEKVHKLSRPWLEQNGYGMVAGWEKFTAWIKQVAEIPAYRGGQHFLSAWNVEFDRTVLLYWQRAANPGLKVEDKKWSSFTEGQFVARDGCAQHLYYEYLKSRGGTRQYKNTLSSALDHFQLPPQPVPHDALSDARAAANVVWRIRLYGNSGKQSD